MSENGSTPEPVPEPAPATPPLTPEAFAAEMDVSRETLDRLEIYVDTLRDWQSRKNLVGAASLADVWRRHILDSAQLFPFLDADDEIVDIRSEEHTSELHSLMRTSYAVFCLNKQNTRISYIFFSFNHSTS